MSHQNNSSEQFTVCVCAECVQANSQRYNSSEIKELFLRGYSVHIHELLLKDILTINDLLNTFTHLFLGGLLYSGTNDTQAYRVRREHRHSTVFSFTSDELLGALIYTDGMKINTHLALEIVRHLQSQLERKRQEEEDSLRIPF